MPSNLQKLNHLWLRAGFGIPYPELLEMADRKPQKVAREMLKQAKTFSPIEVVTGNPLADIEGMEMSKEEKQALRKESTDQIKAISFQWMDRMSRSENALREKMTLFWHGHFACVTSNVYHAQCLNNTLRKYALESFPDMLLAVSKEPAMLQFLNNRQNRKGSPNENFARELMELFTLGRGNYTEDDIKAAARAFTGWNFTEDGDFVFRARFHDDDPKTFMGQTGNFNGDDILKIITARSRCAEYLTAKIYRYFVNDSPDPQQISKLAEFYFKSGYNTGELMERIFTSDFFYEPANIGAHIKNPIELLSVLRRQFNITIKQPEAQVYAQKILGQVLFYPPNVSGWPEGTGWIDSSSLMFRLGLANKIYKMAEVKEKPKADGDVNTDFLAKKKFKTMEAEMVWEPLTQALAQVPDDRLADTLAGYLLQVPFSTEAKALVEKKAEKAPGRSERLQILAVAIASLPEYQVG